MWWWIRHSMCIGDMRFRLENTGKIQIEYIDVFPHIFEVEASQCGGHSKRPLTETMFERESSFSLQTCRKVVSTGSCFQVFGHPPDLPQAVWRHSKFVSAAKQKKYIRGPRLRMTFWNSPGSKKSWRSSRKTGRFQIFCKRVTTSKLRMTHCKIEWILRKQRVYHTKWMCNMKLRMRPQINGYFNKL